ncbi:MAG: hypothetical protein IJQ76_11085 [Prevotella sp.]|nr:hypothetical protein [Prevotella sp.]
MKKTLTILLIGLFSLGLSAQEQKKEKFSPEKFDAELQNYIVKEANLSQQEAAEFFPVYKEMQQKQRTLFDRLRKLGKDKPQDEKACQEAIRQHDDLEIEMKKIQQAYHNRFMELLPASKVYNIMKAEDRFHRRMLRGWGHNGKHGDRQQKKGH